MFLLVLLLLCLSPINLYYLSNYIFSFQLNRFFVIIFSLLLSNFCHAQYTNIVKEMNGKHSVEKAQIFLGKIEELELNRSETQKLVTEVKHYATKNKDKFLLEEVSYIEMLWEEERENKNLSTDAHLRKFIEKIESSSQFPERIRGYAYHNLAQIYFDQQKYALAFESFFKAMEIFENIGFEHIPTVGKFLHDFALSRYHFKEYEEVINLMNQSLKFPAFNKNYDIQRYNNIGVSYFNLHQYEKAYYYLKKTKEVAKYHKIWVWDGIVSGSLGELYFKQNKFEEALQQFKNQLHHANLENIVPMKIMAHLNLSKSYGSLGEIQLSNQHLLMAETLINKPNIRYFGDQQQIDYAKQNYFDLKVKQLRNTNDFEQTLNYQDSFYRLSNELDKKYNRDIIQVSSDRLRLQQNKLKLQEYEKEKLVYQYYNFGLLIAFFIVCLLITLYFYLHKLKKKRREEQFFSEQQITLLKKQQIEQELIHAKQDIETFVQRITEQNSILTTFEQEISKLKSVEKFDDEWFHNLRILTDEDWIAFQHNFDKVYPEFSRKIKYYQPALTTSELRYIMLHKLDFHHKEMARAIGVSDNTIRVTWSRVKKKLNGDANEKAEELITRIFDH